MCEVRSKEKTTKNKPPKKVQWSTVKRNGMWWTPYDVKWKNATHPMDRTANWCISACWFTLAHFREPTLSTLGIHSIKTHWEIELVLKMKKLCIPLEEIEILSFNQGLFALLTQVPIINIWHNFYLKGLVGFAMPTWLVFKLCWYGQIATVGYGDITPNSN
jgi:hypothetical protein